MNKLKIGIVGCGAIGSSLAKAIVSDFSDRAELVKLYDADSGKACDLSMKLKTRSYNSLNDSQDRVLRSMLNDSQDRVLREMAALNMEELISKAELVIEATKAESAYDIAKKSILASRDIMVMSVGGIIEKHKELELLAKEKGAHIFIPSGAICGIDGLKASACGKINKVILTTRKHPKAFSGVAYVSEKKIRLDSIDKDTVIFEGNARLAIRAFPQNINVAATLSLAGLGEDNTIVRIVASPGADKNIHEVEVESDAGKIFCRTENVIHPDNPKTSYLAVLSAVATLKQILEPVKIGT